MKKVVVLGGGYAGVLTAKKLAKKFKKNKDVQITLIDNRITRSSRRTCKRRVYSHGFKKYFRGAQC